MSTATGLVFQIAEMAKYKHDDDASATINRLIDEARIITEDYVTERRREIVSLADDVLGVEGHIEIDDDALLSEGENNGCYVQAWVWLPFDGTKFDKEKEEENENQRHPQIQETPRPDSQSRGQ